MPISNLESRALDRLTTQQLADLALAADQERREQARAGNQQRAIEWMHERDRLLDVFDRRAA